MRRVHPNPSGPPFNLSILSAWSVCDKTDYRNTRRCRSNRQIQCVAGGNMNDQFRQLKSLKVANDFYFIYIYTYKWIYES